MHRCVRTTGRLEQLQVAKAVPGIGRRQVQGFLYLARLLRVSTTDCGHAIGVDVHAIPHRNQGLQSPEQAETGFRVLSHKPLSRCRQAQLGTRGLLGPNAPLDLALGDRVDLSGHRRIVVFCGWMLVEVKL
ncbi:hypothetical protein D3C84_655560 [compost metagenome]